MGRLVQTPFRRINIPKLMKFILIIIIFQICFFILQLSFSYLTNWIFWYNHRIGLNQWNYWIFDYPSGEVYLNSFWGAVTTDFYSLILSIFITLSILNEDEKLWGWRLLLIYRIIIKILLLGVGFYFSNTNMLINIGYGILFTFFDLIPFGIYRLKER